MFGHKKWLDGYNKGKMDIACLIAQDINKGYPQEYFKTILADILGEIHMETGQLPLGFDQKDFKKLITELRH